MKLTAKIQFEGKTHELEWEITKDGEGAYTIKVLNFWDGLKSSGKKKTYDGHDSFKAQMIAHKKIQTVMDQL